MRYPDVRLLGIIALLWAGSPALAGPREVSTVETATDVVASMGTLTLKGIPPALMQDAQAVAVIPNMIKAGFVVGGRHGRGVVVVRDAAGGWGPPVFVTLSGGSFGWQIGVQSTDVVLVFKTRAGIERILKGKGKLTLGADASIAAGPVGRQAEAGTDAMLKAEIYSWSRSRGLFAGVSLEGAAMLVDTDANEAYYAIEGVRPMDILGGHIPAPVSADRLRGQLTQLSGPPASVIVAPAPAVIVPPPSSPTEPPLAPPPMPLPQRP